MKSCTIITCDNCEFYNTKYCKNCSKEGDDCYEHWEWRHDVSWRQEQIDNLTQKIADLEAKLAEMTEKYNACQEARKLEIEFNKQDKAELKQQLAEKEEMIEKLKDESVKYYCAAFNYKERLKQHDQDKISFAVEQLTQAKEYIKNSLENMWNGNAEMTCRDRNVIDGIYTRLDEQIAELTHQHEDKGE